MEIKETREEGVLCMEVHGKLDASTSPQLTERFEKALSRGDNRIICDIHGVGYISSAGIGAFLSINRHLKSKSGCLAIVGMTPEVRDVFDLMKFTDLFQLFDSISDARKFCH